MNRLIAILWCTTLLPFATLPWVFIAQEQPAPWYLSHLAFHVLYPLIAGIAIWAALRVARNAPTRAIARIGWLITAAQIAGIAGHIGELIAVLREGGVDAGEEIFEGGLHEFAANITVPALTAGILLVITLTVVSERRRRRERRRLATVTSPGTL